MADNKPTYNWVNEHKARKQDVEKASVDHGTAWRFMPGIVYSGAILLLTVVLGTEVSKLFQGESVLLQVIGWLGVAVVGLSAIASYFGKGDVYKSARQQKLGMFFWGVEIFALTVGLLVAIASAWNFSGLLVDVARFVGYLAIVASIVGWGIVRWASPDWKIVAQKNRTESDLAVTLSELQAQLEMSDEMIAIRMETARNEARRRAELDRSKSFSGNGGHNNQQNGNQGNSNQGNRNFDGGNRQNFAGQNRGEFQGRELPERRDRSGVAIIPDLEDRGRRELVAERPQMPDRREDRHTGNGHKVPN